MLLLEHKVSHGGMRCLFFSFFFCFWLRYSLGKALGRWGRNEVQSGRGGFGTTMEENMMCGPHSVLLLREKAKREKD